MSNPMQNGTQQAIEREAALQRGRQEGVDKALEDLTRQLCKVMGIQDPGFATMLNRGIRTFLSIQFSMPTTHAGLIKP